MGVALCLAVVASPLARVARAQQIVDQYEPVPGLLRIGPGPDRAVPMTERGHTLILPEGKREGYDEGASPHTWSIVDNGELVDWFLEQVSRPGRTNLTDAPAYRS